MSVNFSFTWQQDTYGCWSLQLKGASVWLRARPHYCDRGHWQANVSGIESIDSADSFPRYFMDFDRAKLEMQDWLVWRLQRENRL